MAIEGGTFKLPSAKKNGRIVALATTIVIVGYIAASFTIRPSKLSLDADGEAMRDHDGITTKSNIRSMSTKATSMRFNPRLKPFGQHVLNGYNSCKDLERDVRAALKLLADTIIAQGKTNDCRFIPMYAEMAMEDSTVSKSDVKETSYGTNNQVDGVDEADIVKSDGTNIFLGYGDQVIVTDLEGNILTNATLPPPPTANLTGSQPMPYDTYSMPKMSIWRPPTPVTRTVQALLLHENIITAIATYNNWECASALCGGVTNAFIYQFNSDDSTLTLLTQLDINGVYCTGRTIGNSAHIAATATVDTWSFTSQLDRYNYEYNTTTAV